MCVLRKSLHKMGTVSSPCVLRDLSFLKGILHKKAPLKAVSQTGSFKPLDGTKTSVPHPCLGRSEDYPSPFSTFIPAGWPYVPALKLCLPSPASPCLAVSTTHAR